MNRLHCMVAIQRAVFDGATEPSTVFQQIRREYRISSGHDELMSRTECEEHAKQSIRIFEQAQFPVERARLGLDIAEGELRADVLDGIAALDISNPRDCRDVYELHQKVGGSTGEPTLREAISTLEAGGQDVTKLTERCDALYPKQEDDDEVK